MKKTSDPKQYAKRDPVALDKLGNYYCRHVSAMTGEGLHSKSDIAAELAFRDAEIDRLKDEVDEASRRRDRKPESRIRDHVVLDPVLRIYLEKRAALDVDIDRITLNCINEWRVMECGLPGLKMSYEDVVLSRRACTLPKSLGKSPVGLCVYDRSQGSPFSCIVCGHPEK